MQRTRWVSRHNGVTMLNIALIGAGTIGRMHAENLRNMVRGARLVAVADVSAAAASACAAQCGILRYSTDFREFLVDPTVHAVAICSASGTHADIVEAAARAGKHIFCEKPIATNIADGERALAAVQQAGVLFQIGFQRRLDPQFMRLRQAVTSGELGRLHMARLISRDPGPPVAGPLGVSGGIWFDMAIHDFDMARWLCGCDAREVFVMGGTLITPALAKHGEVDVAVITLRMENDALVTIELHCDSPFGYDQRAELIGSKASISIGNMAADNAIIGDATGFHRARPLPYFLERYAPVYASELQVFVDCASSGSSPPAGIIDARMSLRMAVAAKLSHAHGRVVRMGEIGS